MSEQEKKEALEAKKDDKKVVKKAVKPSAVSRISKWFRDMRGEIKKVVWPSRSQVINNTVVVIVTILAVGVVIWAADWLLNTGFQAFVKSMASAS